MAKRDQNTAVEEMVEPATGMTTEPGMDVETGNGFDPNDFVDDPTASVEGENNVGDDEEEYDVEVEPEKKLSGWYPAVTTDLEKTDGKNHPQSVFSYDLLNESTDSGKRRTIKDFVSHSPAAKWRLTKAAKAHGIQPELDATTGKYKLRFRKVAVVGNLVMLKLEMETYEGDERPKVKDIRAMSNDEQLQWSDSPIGA